ncbi:30S ribosomal protein S12 methylthiotransferase RimO [Sandaracinus amylolyticus]|uniref:Ribosomal protein uS12 methylthiotransferase RimO n=1 Tax=Sandaracinus amylolyticus TaxID=927083 RepID=A0A0F6YGH2_9BACT|nr:Ribosomal protein S12p Asp88 methylthiotransferase [Sandaracinus amylolyticus]
MAADRTIHFVSLGCPKNRVDTEVMLGVSGLEGYRHVDDATDADVIVVNTCGFIGPAKEESIDTILGMSQLKESGSCKTLVVAGCLSQRYPEQLAAEMPEVDHFLGSSDMLKLKDVLDAPGRAPRMLVGNPADHTIRATDPRLPSLGAHSVYVKIAEGCNRSCSFCAIPTFRGKQRSRPIDDVVRECEMLIDRGATELNLISQDTISYGRDLKDGTELAALVQRVADLPGAKWVRLFYLYPETLKPHLVDLIANHPKVLPYVDMPLQHASDRMLKIMRRGHGLDRQRKVVETLRKNVPNLVMRTAFIVGHPGETDADFAELCDFVTWAEFDRVGVFRYSPEEDTRSHAMEDDVPAKVSNARARKLVALQRPISRRKTKAMIGQEVEVLVEGGSEESEFLLRGRWWGQAPEIDGEVHLANGTAKVGELRKALITAAADHDLVADLADEHGELPEPPDGPRRAPRKPRISLRTIA